MIYQRLTNANQITPRTYKKGCRSGVTGGQLPDMVVTSIDGDNVTCTVGGDTEQVWTKQQVLDYINLAEGYQE